MSERWQSRAACRDVPEIDFTEITTLYRDQQHRKLDPVAERAAGVCARCPVLRECREFAMEHDVDGLAAGTTPYQRKMWRKRRQQRTMRPREVA